MLGKSSFNLPSHSYYVINAVCHAMFMYNNYYYLNYYYSPYSYLPLQYLLYFLHLSMKLILENK